MKRAFFEGIIKHPVSYLLISFYEICHTDRRTKSHTD